MGRTSPIGLEGSELTVSCPFTGVATTCGGSLSVAGAIAQPAVASAQLATIATPMAKRQYCLTGQGPRCVVAMNVVAPDSTYIHAPVTALCKRPCWASEPGSSPVGLPAPSASACHLSATASE